MGLNYYKLRYVVLDALPYEFSRKNTHRDRKRVMQAVKHIFEMIRQGLIRDGSVTIQGFGTFYVMQTSSIKGPFKKVRFRTCESLCRSLDDAQS